MCLSFCLIILPHPGGTIFPYTTLFRSRADCTVTLALTAEFVRELLEGRSLLDEDALVETIIDRYHGSSQRALTASVRSAAAKYRELIDGRSEEHTSELQSRGHLVCRPLLV